MPRSRGVDIIQVRSGEELTTVLKKLNLWQVEPKQRIAPVIFEGFLESVGQLDVSRKKRSFFHALLPSAMIVRTEVEEERALMLAVLAKFNEDYAALDFSEDFSGWGYLTAGEIAFIKGLTEKYRSTRAAELLKRVQAVPISLLLAQAAIESSWGSSRFARHGNNLFGIWTWGENGIIPARREDGKRHRVASYGSIIDSIRAYVVTLNRLEVYDEFREIRRKTLNPLELAAGLLHYSERRQAYVNELKTFINLNDLRRFDSCILDKEYAVPQGLVTGTSLTVKLLVGPDQAGRSLSRLSAAKPLGLYDG